MAAVRGPARLDYPERVIGRSKKADDAAIAPVEDAPTQAAGKGRPTPKRKQAEAANKRPLVVDDRRSAAKRDRSEVRAQRDLEYQAMLSGDDRHMPARDRGPVKRFARDYVDSRLTIGEYFLPVAVVFMLTSLFTLKAQSTVFFFFTGALYLYVIAVVVDSVLLWFGLRKAIVAKFGPAAAQGSVFYGVLRATQLRRTRLPRAQVKRGELKKGKRPA